MLQKEILEFAKLLVQNVRDSAIKSCDNQLYAQNMKAPMAKRWREAKNKENMNEFAEMIIADCVDETLFYLFKSIDEGFVNLLLKASNDKTIDLTNEGLSELSGWYIGEWRYEYSQERASNDFPDIE